MASSAPGKKRLTAEISGRVQGVGFRYYTKAKAQSLGVRGWVRNEADGSVTVVCEGDEAALRSFADWLQDGPPSAHVANVRTHYSDYRGEFSSFSVSH